MSDNGEVQIVVIGATGVGKSSVLNTIIGRNEFKTGFKSVPVTAQCQRNRAEISGWRVNVVDTPDFFNLTHEEDRLSEIKRSVELASPGVHAFLYVLKPTTFTQQEVETVSHFKQSFGEEVCRYMIVVFTHGDQIPQEDMATLIEQNQDLKTLVTRCGGRFTILNNKAPTDREQVYYLMDLINRMVSGQENGFYTLEKLMEAQRNAEEQRERTLAQQRSEEESNRIKHQMDLERAEKEVEIRVREEMKEEREKVRAVEAKNRTEEENNMVDDVEQKPSRKCDVIKTVKRFVQEHKYFCVISFFSLTVGFVFIREPTDRWRFVHGGVLGGSAAALGLMTGKLGVMIWKSQLFTSRSSARQCPVLYQVLRKGSGVLCGALVGSGVGYVGSDQTPALLLATIAGVVGAYTAMHRL